MKIAVAQINTTVGDFEGNAAKIRAAVDKARAAGAKLVVTPEMSLSGYPAEDLWLRDDFCDDCVAEYLQMILKTFLLGIAKPFATSAFGAVSNMMLTLAPTSGSVHSTSAVSLGFQCFAFAC